MLLHEWADENGVDLSASAALPIDHEATRWNETLAETAHDTSRVSAALIELSGIESQSE